MPLPGQVTIRDEFKVQPKNDKGKLYTRLDKRRNVNPPGTANENKPNVPDWLEVNHPLIPITSNDKGYRQETTDRLSQVDELGESANEAVASGVRYNERKAAARALAELQAMRERSQEIYGAVGALEYNFSGAGGSVDGDRGDVISAAKTLLGTPYSWGGGHRSKPGPSFGIAHGSRINGVDCSGLVRYAFAKAGIKKWGGQATSQIQSTYGRVTPVSKLLPGDLVVRGRQGSSHHVAIYLGNGKIIEAQKTGTRVHIRSIGNGSGWTGIHLSY